MTCLLVSVLVTVTKTVEVAQGPEEDFDGRVIGGERVGGRTLVGLFDIGEERLTNVGRRVGSTRGLSEILFIL